MDNMHLVTGFLGREHITAVDQGAFNAALIGTGQFVLDKGNVFEAQVVSNNLIRVLDGELMMQGRFVRVNPGNYVDLAIENGAQGYLRNDLIVARYTKDTLSGLESVNMVVIKGEAVESDPVDPAYTEGDITNGVAVLHEFPLWRIPINGLTVGTPEAMYGLPFVDSMQTLHTIREDMNEQMEAQQSQYEAAFAEQNEAFQHAVDSFGGYTRTETLSDETKTKLGLDAGAVPDDAFSTIPQMIEPVGTIKSTARTDLGDKWLLCNGEQFTRRDYPELSDIFPIDACGVVSTAAPGGSEYLTSVHCYDGVWVATGYASSGIYPFVLTTTDVQGEWVKNTLSDTACYLYKVYCHDGTWVAIGNDTSNNPYIFTTTNPDGEWTKVSLTTLSSVMYMVDVTCCDGTWVALGYDSSKYPYVFTATDPTGTWTAKQIYSTATLVPTAIHCHEGTVVVVGSNTSGTTCPYAFTATDPTGTWTVTQIYSTSSYYAKDIFYHDGTWVALVQYSGYSKIFTATDPTGTWTLAKSIGSSYTQHIHCHEGVWAMAGYTSSTAYMYATTDLTGTWTACTGNVTTALWRDLYCYDGVWVAVGNISACGAIAFSTDPTIMWHEIRYSLGVTQMSRVACYDGTFVTLGGKLVRVATDPAGPWKINAPSSSCTLMRICCHEGVWAVVGYDSDKYPWIYYTLEPLGEWSGVQISSSTAFTPSGVCCYDGTWVVCGYDSNSYTCVSTTTDLSGEWTTTQLVSGARSVPVLHCYEGTWVIAAYCSGSDEERYPDIFVATDPASTWTRNYITSTNIMIQSLHCHDGLWVAVGCYGDTGYRYITTDPTGTWTRKAFSDNTSYNYMRAVTYFDGTWLALGNYGYSFNIYTATDPTGAWTLREFKLPWSGGVLDIAVMGDTWVGVGTSGSSGAYAQGTVSNNWVTLPTISLADDAYTYIKAKEE